METDACNICGKSLSEHLGRLACCPCCGRQPFANNDRGETPLFWADCQCTMTGPLARTIEGATDAWNRRAATAAERELAAAKALLAECQILLRELADETECQCIPAYRERGLHGPNERCHMHTPICELLAKLEAAK